MVLGRVSVALWQLVDRRENSALRRRWGGSGGRLTTELAAPWLVAASGPAFAPEGRCNFGEDASLVIVRGYCPRAGKHEG